MTEMNRGRKLRPQEDRSGARPAKVRRLGLGRLGPGMVAVFALGIAGCAATPPSAQLVAARQAYDAAAQGPAGSVAPEHVLEAKNALKRAEAEHNEDPGSIDEQHLGYLAHRLALVAMAKADATLARQEKERAEQRYTEVLASQKLQAERQLEQQEKSLDDRERQLAAATQQRLDAEQRLATAEQRLRDALSSLERVSNVQMEARGLVITLSGAVLFAFGKSELLPIAETKLREVAAALKDELDNGKMLVIEGHTDSIGSEEANQKLSQARAEAVRDFLIREGVDASKVQAVGKGETSPLVPNDTPEQRANNRRVEIIVSDAEKRPQGTR
jgi:outer membrane protein OmpA-like peptidoglycan-associated protein